MSKIKGMLENEEWDTAADVLAENWGTPRREVDEDILAYMPGWFWVSPEIHVYEGVRDFLRDACSQLSMPAEFAWSSAVRVRAAELLEISQESSWEEVVEEIAERWA